MKNENYITILGWMLNDLHLSGNELLVYATIYGFSQDGSSVFSGSSSYLAESINITKPAVLDILRKLVEKEYIIKIEKVVNNVKLVDYKINLSLVKKLYWGGKESSLGGGKETLPHNNSIDNNRDNNIKENNKTINSFIKESKTSKKEDILLFGEFHNVKLTKEQVKKLVSVYGWYFDDAIETLSSYIESKGDKYKNHYAVLGQHNWVYKKVHENPEYGQRPCCLHIPDETAVGGLRKETALEYYTRKYNWNF